MCSVIQANGILEFKDGLWIGNHLKPCYGLQRVCNIPGFQTGAMRTPRFLGGRLNANLLGSSQELGLIPGSHNVRIEPA